MIVRVLECCFFKQLGKCKALELFCHSHEAALSWFAWSWWVNGCSGGEKQECRCKSKEVGRRQPP